MKKFCKILQKFRIAQRKRRLESTFESPVKLLLKLEVVLVVGTLSKPAIRKWCTLEAQRSKRKQSIVYFGLYVGHVRVVHPVDPKHDP